ncbi:hypothetical protein Mag101_16535 [Microbulbifer agarilyticus]|uniref:Stress response protein n=1 Tax=Microbulbifer agarilyticus TaxID=260552 RepID=A0A1Q2M9U9_9GAMM|nr:hypothetical protein [Microbulbifer agarilyticus]AQQ69057.1 hypothetical protein Mag101_16535 [Microbulbifer agarilyticus]
MTDSKYRFQLQSGEPAKLFPTLPDSRKEEKATSILLATFTVVPDFVKAVLVDAGAPVTSRSKVQCLTEVVFKGKTQKKSRPDGLIVVTTGKKVWSALVESKVGKNELDSDQIEEYLDLAKENGVDAVITISNQFATLPTHHPVKINKQKLRSIGLFHFSWLSLVSKALLLIEGKAVDDTEQAYILQELIRYLRNESSGIQSGMTMGAQWKDVCAKVLQGVSLTKSGNEEISALSSWHQLQRYLCIQLSMAVNKPVKQYLRSKHAKDASIHFQDELQGFIKDACLSSDFVVPNTAGKISLKADFQRKTISVSMKLDAPKDRQRSTASINWLLKQLKSTKNDELNVRAYWPNRVPMTSQPLSVLREDPEALIPPNVKEIPVAFELSQIVDLGAKFKSTKNFVIASEFELSSFYTDVMQNITKWAPKPPKLKEKKDISSLSPKDEFSVTESDKDHTSNLSAVSSPVNEQILEEGVV